MAKNWAFQSAGAVATGVNPTVPLPATYSTGSLLVIVAATSRTSYPFTTPSGWSVGLLNGSINTYLSVWYKFAGASESSVSLTNSESTSVAVMLAYSNVLALDVLGLDKNATSSSLLTNNLTTTTANDLVISCFSIRATTSQAITAGSGYTSRVNYAGDANFASFLIGDENTAIAGATTARTATGAVSALWDTFAISFQQNLNTGNFFFMFN
ncbi:hypothetical protein [Polynucleobacter asymbioticus]|jgi:hypothetical protein|uniref:Uncharacterized protein n=1 Tax=Polynucleobacter asymbioticus TaxID=576611 RepID=A0AAC9IVC1_9BURK|nr:hypothetical protein [Polynucleobacter asymbioticus]APC01323.1 hypothetical protein AOC25_06715 [Polynucleobacter asymbioticus]